MIFRCLLYVYRYQSLQQSIVLLGFSIQFCRLPSAVCFCACWTGCNRIIEELHQSVLSDFVTSRLPVVYGVLPSMLHPVRRFDEEQSCAMGVKR